jgi:hypothetical protein
MRHSPDTNQNVTPRGVGVRQDNSFHARGNRRRDRRRHCGGRSYTVLYTQLATDRFRDFWKD